MSDKLKIFYLMIIQSVSTVRDPLWLQSWKHVQIRQSPMAMTQRRVRRGTEEVRWVLRKGGNSSLHASTTKLCQSFRSRDFYRRRQVCARVDARIRHRILDRLPAMRPPTGRHASFISPSLSLFSFFILSPRAKIMSMLHSSTSTPDSWWKASGISWN